MIKKILILVISITIISCSKQKNLPENDKQHETIFIEQDSILENDSELNSTANVTSSDDFPDLDNLLYFWQIKNLTDSKLHILKNAIFAKHGYIFVSEDLKNHFSHFSWYNGIKNSVNNELTDIDWKNIRLIEREERTRLIKEKTAVNIGKVSLPLRAASNPKWAMKSRLNGKEVIYLDSYYYIDTAKMTAILYFPPDEWWFAARPPFSNNIMPVVYGTWKNDYCTYNIITKKAENDLDVSMYGALFAENEHEIIHLMIHTPEYTLATGFDERFIYIGKNHIMIPEDAWDSRDKEIINNKIINMLISEFNGTVFDNSYILETIRNLLSDYFKMVTKYDMSLGAVGSVGSAASAGRDYFLERMNNFFNINLDKYAYSYQSSQYIGNVMVRTSITNKGTINIYNNGFYIFNKEKIVLLDIKNLNVIIYNYDDVFEFEGDNSICDEQNSHFEIILSDDGAYAYIVVDNYRYKYRHGTRGEVYYDKTDQDHTQTIFHKLKL